MINIDIDKLMYLGSDENGDNWRYNFFFYNNFMVIISQYKSNFEWELEKLYFNEYKNNKQSLLYYIKFSNISFEIFVDLINFLNNIDININNLDEKNSNFSKYKRLKKIKNILNNEL